MKLSVILMETFSLIAHLYDRLNARDADGFREVNTALAQYLPDKEYTRVCRGLFSTLRRKEKNWIVSVCS